MEQSSGKRKVARPIPSTLLQPNARTNLGLSTSNILEWYATSTERRLTMERCWFADVRNFEDMELALSMLRGYLEEVVLSHGTAKVELWHQRRLPQNFQVAEASCEIS
jgi:hypothetical protein